MLASRAVGRLAQSEMMALPFPGWTLLDAAVSLDVMVYVPRGEEGRAVKELVRLVEAWRSGGVAHGGARNAMRSHHAEVHGELQRFTRGQLLQLGGVRPWHQGPCAARTRIRC